jgi:hypothetical protein
MAVILLAIKPCDKRWPKNSKKNAISMHCDRKIKTMSRVTNLMRQKMAADAAERLEEQQRIRAGWQCPEWYGRAHPSPHVTVPAE